jgi:hypothetical protein
MKRGVSDVFDGVLKVAGLANVCLSCGGLTPVSSAVVVVRYPEKPAECPECGLLLNEHGKPVGWRDQDGVVTVRVISLRPDYRA